MSAKLPTLSFYEYLQLRNETFEDLPRVASLKEVFRWTESQRVKVAEQGRSLVPAFHHYLLRGGFPQTATTADITVAQKLLREDIIDKVLKRDMTAFFGVRRVLEMERLFLYLCRHDGGILDLAKLCESLEQQKPTVQRYIGHLEAAHLVYRLPPYVQGKEVLRAKYKLYLADPAIAGSVYLLGQSLLEDGGKLGVAVETAVFKHLFARYYRVDPMFYYWRGRNDQEVDIVATIQNEIVPFEVKYGNGAITARTIPGLLQFCNKYKPPRGYVVTQDPLDFGPAEVSQDTPIMRIPAPMLCFWLSQSETGT